MSHKKPRASCRHCGEPVNTSAAVYCSLRCQKNYQWSLAKTEIEFSGVFLSSCNGTVPKRYLREKHGNQCVICHLTQWMDKEIPLILDHIDGNADNWSVANLRLICPNCDTFTPTYKGRNIGNGRHNRRARYAEGKSY